MKKKHHRKVWEDHHQACLMPGVEVHHIDGDHLNNSPENLLAVTIEEHLSIHLSQQDWGACQAIRMRMALTDDNRQQIKEMASNKQKELLALGRHNWQMPKEVKREISSKVGKLTRDKKIGIHAINANPVLAKQNSSNAGKKSYAKKSGFHSRPYQQESVGGTSWWTNSITGKRKRTGDCPGENWKKGMK